MRTSKNLHLRPKTMQFMEEAENQASMDSGNGTNEYSHRYPLRRKNNGSLTNSHQNVSVNRAPSKKRLAHKTSKAKESADDGPLSQLPMDVNEWKTKLSRLQEQSVVGLWIQCCRKNCGKWRFNDRIHDPLDVPEIWYCDMHHDPRLANCSIPEEKSKIEENSIYNKYNAGSLVWAKIRGYPWWPAMVDDCPSKFRYYELPKNSNVPNKYNVTYFEADHQVRCSWIPLKNLKPYQTNPKEVFLRRKVMLYHGINYKDQVKQACELADEAMKLSVSDRLKNYSFVARWTEQAEESSAIQYESVSSEDEPPSVPHTVARQELSQDTPCVIPEISSRKRGNNVPNVSDENGSIMNKKVAKTAPFSTRPLTENIDDDMIFLCKTPGQESSAIQNESVSSEDEPPSEPHTVARQELSQDTPCVIPEISSRKRGNNVPKVSDKNGSIMNKKVAKTAPCSTRPLTENIDDDVIFLCKIRRQESSAIQNKSVSSEDQPPSEPHTVAGQELSQGNIPWQSSQDMRSQSNIANQVNHLYNSYNMRPDLLNYPYQVEHFAFPPITQWNYSIAEVRRNLQRFIRKVPNRG